MWVTGFKAPRIEGNTPVEIKIVLEIDVNSHEEKINIKLSHVTVQG